MGKSVCQTPAQQGSECCSASPFTGDRSQSHRGWMDVSIRVTVESRCDYNAELVRIHFCLRESFFSWLLNKQETTEGWTHKGWHCHIQIYYHSTWEGTVYHCCLTASESWIWFSAFLCGGCMFQPWLHWFLVGVPGCWVYCFLALTPCPAFTPPFDQSQLGWAAAREDPAVINRRTTQP